jgi:hypothetical protein
MPPSSGESLRELQAAKADLGLSCVWNLESGNWILKRGQKRSA